MLNKINKSMGLLNSRFLKNLLNLGKGKRIALLPHCLNRLQNIGLLPMQ
jgi:hypothetical protein